MSEAGSILWRTALHLVLTFLPSFAFCAWLASRGVREHKLLFVAVLVAPAASGYTAFWLCFIHPRLGRSFSVVLPFAAAVLFARAFQKLDRDGRAPLKLLLKQVVLVGTVALLVLSLGFLYGGTQQPFVTAATRFSHPLPHDNSIPHLFAEGLMRGHVPKPLTLDWLSSDRPPLQTGMVLAQYAFAKRPRDFDYTIVSVILQAQWVLALWLLLTSLGVNTRAVALVLAVSIFSGFAFVNTFYVWPKLLAASYVLSAAAMLLPRTCVVPGSHRGVAAGMTGACIAFAMLAHGSSMFGILGLLSTLWFFKRRIGYKDLALIFVTAACLYLPWLLYQKLYDPPGDRLLKWHLAGVTAVDHHSFGYLFLRAYSGRTFHQVFTDKLANLEAVAGHGSEYCKALFELFKALLVRSSSTTAPAQAGSYLRSLSFFYFTPNLGVLVAGPLVLLATVKRKLWSREWNAAALLWIYVIFTLVIWCLLMFIPGSTIIHQGTYAVVLLAMAGSILAFWDLASWIAMTFAGIQVVFSVVVYVMLTPDPFGGSPAVSLNYGMLALFLAATAAIGIQLVRLSGSEVKQEQFVLSEATAGS
jgi:hypothetical protein